MRLIFILLIAVISSAIACPGTHSACQVDPRSSMEKLREILKRLGEWFIGRPVHTVEEVKEALLDAITKDEEDPNNPCGKNPDGSPKVFLCCGVDFVDIDIIPVNAVITDRIFDPQEMCGMVFHLIFTPKCKATPSTHDHLD